MLGKGAVPWWHPRQDTAAFRVNWVYMTYASFLLHFFYLLYMEVMSICGVGILHGDERKAWENAMFD